MAQTHISSPRLLANFFSFVTVAILIFSASTNSLDQNKHFQVLDVSASIAQTRQLFSEAIPQTQDEKTKTTTTSPSVLSLSLHPRASLLKPQHKNYSAITLSRLARDSARVNSINSKLNFFLSNFTLSDLEPVQTSIRPEDIETPVTSGTRQGSGEYFSRFGIGQPAKEFYMVLDTGSDISWLQCQPCTDCYQQSDPVFDPRQSSSYRPLPCSSSQCTSLHTYACGGSGCLYQVSYGDGSFTVGDFATETLSFGNSGTVQNVAIGCGHDNEGLFVASAGLIGLGGGSLALPSQVKASSFSYCLVNRDSSSSSTLEFNSAPPGDSVFASMLKNPKFDVFFYVELIGFRVGGEKLAIPPSVFQVDGNGRGGIIVDSGTAVTRLQTQAYEALRDTFGKYTQHLRAASGFALFDKCYDLSSTPRVRVPTVSFEYAGGKTLRLRPENYLINVDSSGKFCLAFAPTSGQLSIIGNVQQQGTRVSYDLAKRQIGFSPNKC